jgi:hypothetical protein
MIGIIVQEKPYVKNIPGVQPLGNSALIFPHDFRHRGRYGSKSNNIPPLQKHWLQEEKGDSQF